MIRAQLEVLWGRIRKRLDCAARLLPDPVQVSEDGGTLESYAKWLQHNELELAFDELEMIGTANKVPDDYWVHLAAAAELMNLGAREARCRSRIGAVRLGG